MTDWRHHASRRARTELRKPCLKCGLVVELTLEPLPSGDGYRWIFPVHALFAARCGGSLTEFDPWEGAESNLIL